MANTTSAKQEILVNQRNKMRNQHFKTRLKTAIKSAQSAIDSKAKDCSSIVQATCQLIDQVASKGIIHENAASRKKSRLALRLKAK